MKLSPALFGALLSLLPLSLQAANNPPKNVTQTKPATRAPQGNRFFIFGDFLYWRPDVDGAELATEQFQSADGVYIKKRLIDMKGKWEPGFRVGIGEFFGRYDRWDLALTWTRYYGKSKTVSKTANENDHFLRQGWITFLGPIVTEARGRFSILLNTLDLDLARQFKFGKRVALNPHIGARGAWLNLGIKSNYTGVWQFEDFISEEFTEISADTKQRGHSRFSGGGIRAGSGILWNFARCGGFWGVAGDLSASVLYGRFNVKQNFYGFDPNAGPVLDPLVEKYKSSGLRTRANLEANLGFKWWNSFNCDHQRLSFFAGYEISKWFRFNELFRITRSTDTFIFDDAGTNATNANFGDNHISNDIGFQGLTVKGVLEF